MSSGEVVNTGRGNDSITSTDVEYIGIRNSGEIDTGEGNDSITGTGDFCGIINDGIIRTGEGSDSITGNGFFVGIVNFGAINTGEGNDRITGTGSFLGMWNFGTINTGEGSDNITGTSNEYSTGLLDYGVVNHGIIITGEGNDTITGNAELIYTFDRNPDKDSFGIINEGTSFEIIGITNVGIDTGEGNDSIAGNGDNGIGNAATIDTGEGNDSITGNGACIGIWNGDIGSIKTGKGNDRITGTGGISGILNDGIINTGIGNDTVDALTGGFSGSGLTSLGEGKDTLIGFGTGRFDGGGGLKDKILLSDGIYTFTGSGRLGNEPSPDGYFKLTKTDPISNVAITMLVQNFELIGSAADPDNAIQMNLGALYNIAGNNITVTPLLF